MDPFFQCRKQRHCMLAIPEGVHRRRNQGEIARMGMGMSRRFVLGRLLAGRRWRELLDMSCQPSAQDGCPYLGVQCLRQLP